MWPRHSFLVAFLHNGSEEIHGKGSGSLLVSFRERSSHFTLAAPAIEMGDGAEGGEAQGQIGLPGASLSYETFK